MLFPKYINYHREVMITLKNNDRKKKREFIDFLLVKSNGSVDVIEVKKPDCPSIISNSDDRKNYYPTNSLSKTIMQTEKYIHNLNRNIQGAESYLTDKYKKEYDDSFEFRIMNPKGIVIAGRNNEYNKPQLNDLEIIRRMYGNIIEIYTYDDLIEMLDRQIFQLRKKV